MFCEKPNLTIMKNRLLYEAPEVELFLVRFEENILSGVESKTTVTNAWEDAVEEEL